MRPARHATIPLEWVSTRTHSGSTLSGIPFTIRRVISLKTECTKSAFRRSARVRAIDDFSVFKGKVKTFGVLSLSL